MEIKFSENVKEEFKECLIELISETRNNADYDKTLPHYFLIEDDNEFIAKEDDFENIFVDVHDWIEDFGDDDTDYGAYDRIEDSFWNAVEKLFDVKE